MKRIVKFYYYTFYTFYNWYKNTGEGSIAGLSAIGVLVALQVALLFGVFLMISYLIGFDIGLIANIGKLEALIVAFMLVVSNYLLVYKYIGKEVLWRFVESQKNAKNTWLNFVVIGHFVLSLLIFIVGLYLVTFMK